MKHAEMPFVSYGPNLVHVSHELLHTRCSYIGLHDVSLLILHYHSVAYLITFMFPPHCMHKYFKQCPQYHMYDRPTEDIA